MIALPKKQQGLSLVLAIFILVVLALLGAAMINILTAGTESVAREVVSTRALFAAESGAQWKLNDIFVANGTVDATQCADTNDGDPDTENFPDMTGLFGCNSVSVDCSYVTVNSVNYFSITSTGTCGPANEPAVRVVEVQAKDTI